MTHSRDEDRSQKMFPVICNAFDQLNNREIAVGIWLMAGIGWVLIRKSARPALMNVLKAALNQRLVILFVSFAVYVSILTWVLSEIGLWTRDQFMATVLWYFLSGLGVLFAVFQTKEGDRFFRKLATGAVSATAVFEFVVVFYTFSLVVEIVLVPISAVLGAILAYSEQRKEYKEAYLVAQWALTAIGLAIIAASLWNLIDDPDAFFTTATGRNFILPAFLSIGTIPFYYVLLSHSHIQSAKISLDLKTFQSPELKSYAKRRFTMTFMGRPWLLDRAKRQFHILPARTNADVDKIVEDILTYERNEECPPDVDASEGWSPYASRELLAEHGLRTSDYHAGYGEEEYFANSEFLELGDPVSLSTAALYIEGEKEVVKTLKLKGHFRDDPIPDTAVDQFRELAIALVVAGEGVDEDSAKSLVPGSGDFEISHGATTIGWRTERFPSELGFEVYFTLSR